MRLSLRTLLAFEDNVFDVEQHRRLEQLLPTDKNAEATLQRMRSVVRNSSLGVPGLVDRQEELDPNYVAEYLDHQMSGDVQEKFEAYCLSADKYLAEVASVHHILSNVLGEPARTSRECRLKCYEVLLSDTDNVVPATPELAKHFRPYDAPQKPKTSKLAMNRYLAPLWNRLFPPKTTPAPVAPAEKRSPLWTFTVIGLCVCALLLGWQQIEKQRLVQQLRNGAGTEMFTVENISNEGKDVVLDMDWQPDVAESSVYIASLAPLAPLAPLESIEQTAFVSETFMPFTVAPDESACTAVADLEPCIPEAVPSEDVLVAIASDNNSKRTSVTGNVEPETLPMGMGEESIIAFQPITSPARPASEFAVRQHVLPPPPVSVWQPIEELEESTVPPSVSVASVQHPLPSPPPITQMSGAEITQRVLGRVVQSSPSDLVFSAAPGVPWQLPPLPFDLNGEQYLLTAAPFRGTFELAASFRVEMIGDAKLYILPPDASGAPGIFIDYGRLIIYPLRPNQPLRIEMEKTRGIVSSTGTNSVLFIDTFAEISDPPNSVRISEEQKPKPCPILGFVPKNGERFVWQSVSQPQPFYIDSQGCVLLQSGQYRFGEVRLPTWLGAVPMSQEDRMLAEVCWRYFATVRGNDEQALMQALTRLVQNESPAVRTLGLRLWGDLGRFDVPIAMVAERRQGEETIRRVLNQYFEEVMRRDEETVQRFADAIEIVKEAQRN